MIMNNNLFNIFKLFVLCLLSDIGVESLKKYSYKSTWGRLQSHILESRYMERKLTTESTAEADRPLYGGLHHCGIIVRNATLSKTFYTEVFGFTDESHLRPANLPYPGAFLCCGGTTQIHLMELPDPDKDSIRPAYPGRDRHVALRVDSVDKLSLRLAACAVPHQLSSSGRKALFCRDPDGNGFEFVELAWS